MIAFQREAIADIRREMLPLVEAHYAEIAHYQDIPLAADWEFYTTSKAMRAYTARCEGALVGYAFFGVGLNKHYMGSLQAVQDVLFLHPDHRKGLTGFRFIRFCDEQLKAEGVQVVYQRTKAAANFGPVLKRLGYEEVDVTYAKRLDKG